MYFSASSGVARRIMSVGGACGSRCFVPGNRSRGRVSTSMRANVSSDTVGIGVV